MEDREPVFQKRAVLALARQGFRHSIESAPAYVALFVFYLLTGYLFVMPFFIVGQTSLKGLLDFEPLLISFIVPALTMGLLSEELKSGTFETLATLPLEDWDIVLGKYLGFAVLYAVAVAGLLFLAVAASRLAVPSSGIDWGETLGVLAAVLLHGLALGAAGIFCSSLSRNQIVSFILAFIIGFCLLLFGKISVFFSGWTGILVDFAGLDSHLDALAKGVVDTRDLIYFASVIFTFLYLAAQRLRTMRR